MSGVTDPDVRLRRRLTSLETQVKGLAVELQRTKATNGAAASKNTKQSRTILSLEEKIIQEAQRRAEAEKRVCSLEEEIATLRASLNANKDKAQRATAAAEVLNVRLERAQQQLQLKMATQSPPSPKVSHDCDEQNALRERNQSLLQYTQLLRDAVHTQGNVIESLKAQMLVAQASRRLAYVDEKFHSLQRSEHADIEIVGRKS